nr:hypothetical protein Iba_chr01cCG3810 [Ipomoea batatas]
MALGASPPIDLSHVLITQESVAELSSDSNAVPMTMALGASPPIALSHVLITQESVAELSSDSNAVPSNTNS